MLNKVEGPNFWQACVGTHALRCRLASFASFASEIAVAWSWPLFLWGAGLLEHLENPVVRVLLRDVPAVI